jgi:7-cyano-7-deazaguanine reductase
VKYLGNKSEFAGLEIIEVNCIEVTLMSDEVTANCPITGQPDFYTVSITIAGGHSIESKSLKLYFQSMRNEGMFCENLAGRIKQDINALIDCPVSVIVIQKPRGGISIKATA